MEEFRSVMEEMSENTHLRETHTLVSSLADCSAWKQFLLSFLLKKNMTHENFRIFQATLIWDMFSCFPRSFYKRCSDALSADQSTGSKGPAASFPGAGPAACAPEGRMRSAPHLVALGAPSAPLPWRASSPTPQVQSRHLPAGVTRASLFEGLEGTGQSVDRREGWREAAAGLRREGGVEGAAAGLGQARWEGTSAHSDLLVSTGFAFGADSRSVHLPPYSWGSCELILDGFFPI